jgi:hypothetical protein
MSGGCGWEPAELDEESYAAVVQELLARPPQQFDYGGGQLREVGTYRTSPRRPGSAHSPTSSSGAWRYREVSLG